MERKEQCKEDQTNKIELNKVNKCMDLLLKSLLRICDMEDITKKDNVMCPECESKNVVIRERKVVVNYKGKEIETKEEYYHCENCYDNFNTAQQIEKNIKRVMEKRY